MNFFDPQQWEFWKTIGVAVGCGAVVGLERQVRGKPSGLRTSILVCLGTMLFVKLGISVAGTGGDPGRVLGQIVTGIGFLGAGVMFIHGSEVYGVTSASVIWVLAAIGAAVGFGYFSAALSLSLLTVVILAGIEVLETGVAWLSRGVHSRKNHDEKNKPDGSGPLKDL